MNYQKIYDDICERGQGRQLPKDVYTEKHHIVPKCLGGGNEKSNLTVLTAREHFLVHYLLTRIYPDNSKIWNACFKMCQVGRGQKRFIPNSKLYEEIRTNWNKLNRGTNHFAFGVPKTDAHKKAIGDAHRGKKIDPKSIEKRRITIENNPIPYSKERRESIREFLTDNNPNSRKCSVNENIFISVAEAARNLDISYGKIKKRLNSSDEEWKDWFYLEESKVSIETREKFRKLKTGTTHSDKTKKLLSELNSGEKNSFFGKQHSEESNQKNRDAHLGKKSSEETKQKLKDRIKERGGGIWKGVCGEDNPNFGRKHTEEFCQQISERQTGENNSFFGKRHTNESKEKISIANRGKLNSFYGKKHPPEIMEQMLLNNPQRKPCLINGMEFLTRSSVKKYFKISDSTLTYRLESDDVEWLDWKYLEK